MIKQKFRKILIKAVRSIYYCQRHIILTRDLKVPKISLDDIHIRSIREDSEALTDLSNHVPHKAKIIQQRLEAGVDCYVVYNDTNKMIAYGWYATRDFYEPMQDVTFMLQKGQVYPFDVELLEEYRGQFMLAPKLAYLFWNHYITLGYNNIICMVDLKNTASLQLHAFMNFKEFGEMILTRFIFTKPFTTRRRYTGSYFDQ
ncbi:MAG: hypothetical protein KKE17_09985 [Proteobacteria bacterium]|nr:hypothetical protein [Pseudomonadota bacterium]MBU1710322.1 hypothetical protein [Pseudomonadota bacterium]